MVWTRHFILCGEPTDLDRGATKETDHQTLNGDMTTTIVQVTHDTGTEAFAIRAHGIGHAVLLE
jgi:ABC-type lipoprotein export system ATPase subunit